MRLILDTNILVSALLSPLGRASQASRRLGAEDFHARSLGCTHSGIPGCRRPPFFRARLRTSAAELLAAGLRDFSFYLRDLPSGPIAPDPKDSYLLAMAEASQAEFLVTGDKELLSLKHHKSTRIVTPAAMIEVQTSGRNRWNQLQAV